MTGQIADLIDLSESACSKRFLNPVLLINHIVREEVTPLCIVVHQL
jgi:hypothetical protein